MQADPIYDFLRTNIFNPPECCQKIHHLQNTTQMMETYKAYLQQGPLDPDHVNVTDTQRFVAAINLLPDLTAIPPHCSNIIKHLWAITTPPTQFQPTQFIQSAEENTLLHNTLCTCSLLIQLPINPQLNFIQLTQQRNPHRSSYLHLPPFPPPEKCMGSEFNGANLRGADFTGIIFPQSSLTFQQTDLTNIVFAESNPQLPAPPGKPRFIPNCYFINKFINDHIENPLACAHMVDYCRSLHSPGNKNLPDLWLLNSTTSIFQNKDTQYVGIMIKASMAFMAGVLTTAGLSILKDKHHQFVPLFDTNKRCLLDNFRAAAIGSGIQQSYTSMLRTCRQTLEPRIFNLEGLELETQPLLTVEDSLYYNKGEKYHHYPQVRSHSLHDFKQCFSSVKS